MKTKLLFTALFMGIFAFSSIAQTYELWGITGGSYTAVFYKTDANGDNVEIVYKIPEVTMGKSPKGKLFQADNGKLYGTLSQGGDGNNNGVLFGFDTKDTVYTVLVDFSGKDGNTPDGDVIQAANGKLYGMTRYGGYMYDEYPPGYYSKSQGYGIIFEYDIATSTYKLVWEFNVIDGIEPFGSLIQADDGFLYGMTSGGKSGISYYGTLFKYDIDNDTLIVLHNFEPGTGKVPLGSLMQASNGRLYGMTSKGGSNYGVLFEYNITDSIYTMKHAFNKTNGALPTGSLIEASDGKLYGITDYGGVENIGVLFQYDIDADTLIKKVDFQTSIEGNHPQDCLLEASNGKMYGLTYLGGGDSGAMFEYDPVNNTSTKKFNYGGGFGYPSGGLIEIEGVTVGVKEDAIYKEVKIWPNPTEEMITIDFNENKNVQQVNLLSIDGRLIRKYNQINNRKFNLFIEGESGIYLVEVLSAEKRYVFKVVKK